MKDRFLRVFQKQTVKSAIKVSLFVGIILNLINQGEAIVSLDVGKIDWLKLLLTFFVPFAVSVYSAAITKKAIHNTGNKN